MDCTLAILFYSFANAAIRKTAVTDLTPPVQPCYLSYFLVKNRVITERVAMGAV